MHIAFLLSDLKGGGAQKMLINLANWFAQNGHKSEIILFSDIGKYKDLIAPNVTIHNFEKTRALYAILPLTRYIKTEKPDILFSALPHVNITALFARFLSQTRIKIVISERNHATRSLKNTSPLKRLLWHFLMRLFYPKSDSIIGISEGVSDDLKKLFPSKKTQDKIKTIHNPVVTDNFKSCLNSTTQNIFPPDSAPKLIASGRLVTQKDYPTLLKAFALYVTKNPKAHLVVLGDGFLKNDLDKLCQDLKIEKNITFKGFVDSPLRYIKQADIFIMTSAWEGFCNVIVEALYCGLKIIATDCPSGPAEILENSKYGILCPVGNSNAIANAIEQSTQEQANPARQKKRALDFHVDKIGEEFLKHFETLKAPQ